MLTRLLDGDPRSRGAYVAEVIYGANDGIVPRFAVVAAAVASIAGALLSGVA